MSLPLAGGPEAPDKQLRMATKLQPDVDAALDGLEDGATIAVGGFGLSGNPEALIEAVRRRAPKNLTLVSNNAGAMGRGLATWLEDDLVAKIICTYVGTNQDLHARMAEGSIDVTIVPQGTFVERMRAAGAGLAGFYTPTGVGTVVAEGKDTREFEGRTYVLERALPVDVALVRCRVADPFGNLRFYRTSRNFQPAMAMAAKVAIAEAETVVPLGGIDPDDVHLSGAFVQRVVHVPEHEDVIEFRTVRKRENA
ncbi:MAG: CoA transferase subunit A [Myxococcota bacterium]